VANFVYTPAKQKMAKGDADFDTLDVRAILVMTNTTADTDQDAANIAAIGTLDEFDGSGYSRPDLGASTITQDDANNRSEIDYADFTFGTAVGAGTRQAAGIIIYVRVDGTNANDWPVGWIDTVSTGPTFPFSGNGGAINVTVDAQALLQVT
jgi:hypothetical protein